MSNEKLSFLDKYVKGKGLVKPNRKAFIVDPDAIRSIFQEMINNLGYEGFYLSTIVATDLKDENKIRLDYYVVILPEEETIALRTYLPRESPKISSIIDLVPGALAGECEAHDLVGVVFEGNPHLKRGFFASDNVVEAGEYPLRKDSKV